MVAKKSPPVIELVDVYEPLGKRIKRKIRNFTLLSSSLVGLYGYAAIKWDLVDVNAYLPKHTVVVEIEKENPTFAQLLKTVPVEAGIPAEVTAVVYDKEHAPWCRGMACVRFEPGQLEKYGKRISKNEDTAKMWASSICPMQVMAWHLKLDGQDYGEFSELFRPEVCVAQYTRIMSECLKRWAHLPRYDQLSQAFRCYNGSQAYADDAMQKLARIAVERL